MVSEKTGGWPLLHFHRELHIYIYISGWWFQTFFIFHFIYGIILPIDELIFFKMVVAPPTRYPWKMANL